MRRPLVLVLVVLGVLVLFLGAIYLRIQSQKPETLLRKLRTARGADRELLVMKLGIAGGDVVAPMVAAFQDASAPLETRLLLLDLLFRKHQRTPDDRIAAVLSAALAAQEVELRRAAAEGLATYGTEQEQVRILDSVKDPDPAVRRTAYGIFLVRGRGDGTWGRLEEPQRQHLVELARAQVPVETDPELKLQAQAILGRAIGDLCQKASEALQKADIVKAEQILREALALDPENHQARIRLARTLLATGDKEKALKLAEEYGSVFRIPMLPSAPVIDGDPTDAAWKQALSGDLKYLNTYRWFGRPCQGKSRFSIGHRDGKVYVTVIGYEDDLSKLVVKHKNRDDDNWEDDCVELFFDPANTEREIYQFVITAGGTLADMYRMELKVNMQCEYAARVFTDRGYWACEFAVPASELGGAKITADSLWTLNIVRTRIGAASECCSFWPLNGQNHNYPLFPLAVFDMKPAGGP